MKFILSDVEQTEAILHWLCKIFQHVSSKSCASGGYWEIDHIVWYTVAAQSTDAMARGFPQSQQSIYSSADGDAIIKGLFPLSKFLVI